MAGTKSSSTKSSAKGATAKRTNSTKTVVAGTQKPAVKPKATKQAVATPKTVAAPRTAAKGVPKAAPAPRARKATDGAKASKPGAVPAEQRRNYIEMAAYYIAERRGFAPGNPLEDWVQAEAEIDRLLAEGRLGG